MTPWNEVQEPKPGGGMGAFDRNVYLRLRKTLKKVTEKRRRIPRLVTLDLAARRSLRGRLAPGEAPPLAPLNASEIPDFLPEPEKRLEDDWRDIGASALV